KRRLLFGRSEALPHRRRPGYKRAPPRGRESSRRHQTATNQRSPMAVTQTPLPYAKDALEPHMSSKTFDFHYGKHHKTYVDNTNAAIKGTPLENASLEEIVKSAK